MHAVIPAQVVQRNLGRRLSSSPFYAFTQSSLLHHKCLLGPLIIVMLDPRHYPATKSQSERLDAEKGKS